MVQPGKSLFLALVAGASALLCGCASSDLSADPKIRESVVECLPTDVAAPTLVVRALWFPKAVSIDSAEGHQVGVLAVAGDRLWFMTWNDSEKHFDLQRTVVFVDAVQMHVDYLGASAMLIVQSANNAFDGFELMGESQITVDMDGTQSLYERLESRRRAHVHEIREAR